MKVEEVMHKGRRAPDTPVTDIAISVYGPGERDALFTLGMQQKHAPQSRVDPSA